MDTNTGKGVLQASRTKDGFRLSLQRVALTDRGYGPEEFTYHVASFDLDASDLGYLATGQEVTVEALALSLTEDDIEQARRQA